MTARDRLARHWRHPIRIERLLGVGASGDVFAPAEVIAGAVDDKARQIVGPNGATRTAAATVALPLVAAGRPVDPIPTGSRITLPGGFATKTGHVLEGRVGDSGGLDTPDHMQLLLG